MTLLPPSLTAPRKSAAGAVTWQAAAARATEVAATLKQDHRRTIEAVGQPRRVDRMNSIRASRFARPQILQGEYLRHPPSLPAIGADAVMESQRRRSSLPACGILNLGFEV